MIVTMAVVFAMYFLLARVFLVPFLFAFIVVAASADAGSAWGIALFTFGLLSVFDLIVPQSERHRQNWPSPLARIRAAYAGSLLWLWAGVQLVVLPYVLVQVSDVAIDGRFWSIAFAVGIMTGGVGITVAHEMMHSRSSPRRALAEILMTTVIYTHFCIEHVHGHHVRVGTEEDPATARRGETVYRFLPRTIVGGFRSARAIERRRCARRGVSSWSLRNANVRYPVMMGLAPAGALVIAGWKGLFFFVIQASVAVVLLETINYIEHYGLARAKLESGRYEPVSDQHSWDSNHYFTNGLLFNLGRHSDHHRHAARRYILLESTPMAPNMPLGYTGMAVLAFLSPLWLAVMDRRIESSRASHTTGERRPVSLNTG